MAGDCGHSKTTPREQTLGGGVSDFSDWLGGIRQKTGRGPQENSGDDAESAERGSFFMSFHATRFKTRRVVAPGNQARH